MALVITITGVYAAWTYSEGSVAATTKYLDGVTSITTATQTNAKGVITVDPSNFSIVIDDTNHDYVGELSVTGSIKITFTPNAGASVDKIKMQYKLVNNNLSYNGGAIFTFNTAEITLNNGEACSEIIITAEQFLEQTGFALDGILELPTYADYTTFKEALHAGSIGIVVSEIVDVVANG